jgi:hypothetical protein
MNNIYITQHQTLMLHRQSIDRLFWSRTQTLYALQAAVIGGAFAVKNDGWYAWALLLLGAILTVLLGLLCCYDWQGVKVNEVKFFKLCDKLQIYWDAKHKGIREHLPGNIIFMWIILLFIWLDLGLGSAHFWNWQSNQILCKVIILGLLFLILLGWSFYFNRYWKREAEPPEPQK